MDSLKEWVDSHKNVRKDWLENYTCLKKYHETHGHSHVGAYENPQLHQFCLECRQTMGKRVCLNDCQVKLLEELGFAFSSDDYIWHRKFQNVKQGEQEKIWCSRQRAENKKNNLSQEKIYKLDSIGFVWELRKKTKKKLEAVF